MANEPTYPNGSRTAEACARRETRWRDVLGRWKRSSLTKTAFAQQEGISLSVLSWWSQEIARRDRRRQRRAPARPKPALARAARPAFIPLRIVEPATMAPLEVVAGGRSIHIRPGFDPELLRRLISALEERPC